MGLVYAPQIPFGSKGATSGPFRQFNPRLVGFGGGAGAIRKGLQIGYRFVRTNYKFFTRVSSVGAGAGVANLVGQSDDKLGKTYRSNRIQQYNGRSNVPGRFSRTSGSTKCCHRSKSRCCCQSNLRRNVVSRRSRY